jgi:hypothetical protein
MFGMGMCINLKPPKENEDRKIKGNVKKKPAKEHQTLTTRSVFGEKLSVSVRG